MIALPTGLNTPVAGPDDPSGFGVDLLCNPDLDPASTIIVGVPVYAQDLLHRLSTPSDHPIVQTFGLGKCYDLTSFINEDFDLSDGKQLAIINSTIEECCEADERTKSAAASSTYSLGLETLYIDAEIAPNIGAPFVMIVGVTSDLVTLLGLR